ncbi:MAG: 1-acyl-sn-glycerol-3-phosphate acyltransferase [Planctomycetaceae bacterium]|nr:1-acyl-sn-glycerol-3-phosphate acyltransferase [Planctomycetaceae bacterium]
MSSELWAILTLVAYAVVALVMVVYQARLSPSGWKVWVIHAITRFFTTVMCGQRIQQRCPFPSSGNGLVIANHRSPVDPFLLCSASQEKLDGHCVRSLEFMTATEYVEMGGIVGLVCGIMGCIPVDRDGRDMGPAKVALRRIKAGSLVGVFPEGRINTGEGLLPASPGIAWLAVRSRAPVYPAFIHDAPQGTSMVNSFLKRSKSYVTYGEPIDLSDYYHRKPTPAMLDEVTDLLMSRLGELGGVKPSPRQRETWSNGASNHNGSPTSDLEPVGAE